MTACRVAPSTGGVTPGSARTPGGLWYDVRGRGPAIVLVHGANLDSRTMEPVARDLARDHRVVMTDLRLHGQSVDDGARFSFATDVREVMDVAGIEHATVVGHSLGAAVAIELALAQPDRVDGLVLAGPSVTGFSPSRPVPGLRAMAAAARAGDWPLVARELAASPVMRLYGDTAASQLLRTIIAGNLALLRADPSRLVAMDPPAARRLAELRTPVVLVTGASDSTTSSEAADYIRARVAGARSEVVPGCGHIVPLDCPGPLIAAIRSLERGQRPRD